MVFCCVGVRYRRRVHFRWHASCVGYTSVPHTHTRLSPYHSLTQQHQMLPLKTLQRADSIESLYVVDKWRTLSRLSAIQTNTHITLTHQLWCVHTFVQVFVILYFRCYGTNREIELGSHLAQQPRHNFQRFAPHAISHISATLPPPVFICSLSG